MYGSTEEQKNNSTASEAKERLCRYKSFIFADIVDTSSMSLWAWCGCLEEDGSLEDMCVGSVDRSNNGDVESPPVLTGGLLAAFYANHL